jgi:low affinity Fe/Cu permease
MHELFRAFAQKASQAVGSAWAFMLAVAIVLVWGITGPLYGFSDTWQLVINTGTSLLTFLMVFLLQNTQNRDSRATQIKLDELLRAMKGARNELVDLQNVSEQELTHYCEEFKRLHLRYAEALKKRGGHAAVPGNADADGKPG